MDYARSELNALRFKTATFQKIGWNVHQKTTKEQNIDGDRRSTSFPGGHRLHDCQRTVTKLEWNRNDIHCTCSRFYSQWFTELSIFCKDVIQNEKVSLQSNKTMNNSSTCTYLHGMNEPMQIFEVKKNALAIMNVYLCTFMPVLPV